MSVYLQDTLLRDGERGDPRSAHIALRVGRVEAVLPACLWKPRTPWWSTFEERMPLGARVSETRSPPGWTRRARQLPRP
jgi:hypothetical protein